MYLIESAFTGLSVLLLGLELGALSGGLFQMILLAIYLFFAGKGYVSIVRSSVLNLISAARQSEYVREKRDTGSKIGGRRGSSWSTCMP